MDKETEKRFNEIEIRLKKLEKIILESRETGKVESNSVERILIEKIKDIPVQHLVIISLKIYEKQPRDEIKETLQDWGKVFGNWFKGGNFNNRLVKTNIVKPVEKNEEGKEVFSLTKKGKLLADELIEKINQ